MSRDIFPQTQATWIDQRLREGEGGRRDLHNHIMTVYREPLKVYFLGSSERWLGEAEDVVSGFFASRLGREDFYDDWKKDGKRLRRWLINAFCFYLKEMRRARRRDQRYCAAVEEPPTTRHNPEKSFRREYIRQLVQRAMAVTAEKCQEQALGEHWNVFLQYYVHGHPYQQLVEEFGGDVNRIRRMARTAREKFANTLREVMEQDGIPTERIDDEIRRLMEG